ncbi:ammonium transporter [Stygiobacter electus]|uniref:Ammonium transporter n=1 Tax=Stygiobacter electus TaxID=3032292 RepID=A0AAE3NVL9_9BACT|nr:ammonium transporter [Stygiobacter electus]MDF1611666.1 ammonium transporter [Stygiobacter electus]
MINIKRNTLLLFILLGLFFAFTNLTFSQTDPTGNKTGTIKDVPATTMGNPTFEEVAKTVGHNKISINIIWTMIAGFLVMFMQAGFAMVETGFTRAKNVAHTMGMNFLVYAIGMIGFWICGFAFMFGGVGGIASLGGTPGLDKMLSFNLFGKTFEIIGYSGFFLNGSVYDVGVFALFLFQMVFMDTTATIPTGSMAERWKFTSFIFFAFFISMFVYPIYGNWVWGGGWLADLGVNFGLGHGQVDFAGSSVVHLVGGVAALAGAIVIGPRIGKYSKNGTSQAIPGHNIPMAIVGTFILAFGWFGFNAGSTLAGTDLRLTVVATNTMLASGAGALAATLLMIFKFGKPDPSMMANGLLAGLVAITAPCAFVPSWASFVIGAIAGILVVYAVFFIDQKLKIDDPVGAVAVNGVNGAWGVLSLGLFADGTYGDGWNGVAGGVKGLFYGDAGQLVAQIIGVITAIIFVFILMYTFFKVQDKYFGIRVDSKDEIAGLDMPEMGIKGYELE